MCDELEAKNQKLDTENDSLKQYRSLQNDKMTDLEAKIEKLGAAPTKITSGISAEREKVLEDKIKDLGQ